MTLKLNEVPWGRALELILKTNGLGCVLEDNVIRIARLTDLQKEEERPAQAGRGEGARRQPGRLHAAHLVRQGGRPVQGAEERGRAFAARADQRRQRTNTVIIRDLPSYVDKAKGLMAELDTATPQVEIEARIVVTNRNFSRDFGIQWGFGGEQTARFGNTTGRVFPNQMVVNGGGVPSRRSGGGQHRAGRPVVRGRHRPAGPRLRRQPARVRTSTARSASRWATCWAASTWT